MGRTFGNTVSSMCQIYPDLAEVGKDFIQTGIARKRGLVQGMASLRERAAWGLLRGKPEPTHRAWPCGQAVGLHRLLRHG
jgi:hypothetical protein